VTRSSFFVMLASEETTDVLLEKGTRQFEKGLVSKTVLATCLAAHPKCNQPRPPRVRPQPLDAVVFRGVRPQQVHQNDPLPIRPSIHRERPLQGLDLLHLLDRPPDAAMHADDLVLDERGQREPVEELVDALPGVDAGAIAL
jgi:hypothetical protein